MGRVTVTTVTTNTVTKETPQSKGHLFLSQLHDILFYNRFSRFLQGPVSPVVLQRASEVMLQTATKQRRK